MLPDSKKSRKERPSDVMLAISILADTHAHTQKLAVIDVIEIPTGSFVQPWELGPEI